MDNVSTCCLNCCYFSEPEDPHIWHWCNFVPEISMAQTITKMAIDINEPKRDCPVWRANA